MPPKVYKRVSSQSTQSSSSINRQQQSIQQQRHAKQVQQQQLFANPKHHIQNSKTLERIRILISLLSGIIAGLFNVNQVLGPVVYVIMHLLMTAFMIIKIGDVNKFFMKNTDIFSGIGSGVLIFICAWMIVYNVVYTL